MEGSGTFLGSVFVTPATELCSCLLALHMFGNHYICVLTGDIVISRNLSYRSMISTKPRWSMFVIELPHSSWNRWSQSEENFMLMKLCGLIIYMVLRKCLHSSLTHEFCDIVVKLVNYGCDIVIKPVMLLYLWDDDAEFFHMMHVNYVDFCEFECWI
jgi:hypothetical protein